MTARRRAGWGTGAAAGVRRVAGVQGVGLAALAGGGYGYPVLVGAVLAIAVGQMLYAPAVSTFAVRAAAPLCLAAGALSARAVSTGSSPVPAVRPGEKPGRPGSATGQ